MLCAACDHRIKGYPYCQDCIVLGIDYLNRHQRAAAQPNRGKARLAALCAIILPGLGAVYNRQNIKAIIHFVTIVGLFQLSGLHVMRGFFVLAGLGSYFYSIIDAYRTAVSIAAGESPEANETRFKQTLARKAPTIGIILIVAGLIAVVQVAQPLGFAISVAKLLPVALLLVGAYLVTRYFKRSREQSYNAEYSRKLPYSLIPGGQNSEDFNRSSRRSDYR
jgi:hypothetical protein